MNARCCRWAVTAVLVLAAASTIWGQPSPQAPRRLLVAVEARGEAWSEADVLLVSRSLLHAIQDSGSQILLLDWGPGPFLEQDDEQMTELFAHRADSWLLITLSGGSDQPVVNVRSRDLLASELVIEERLETDAPLDQLDLSAVWKPLVDQLAAIYKPVDTSQPLESLWAERPPMWSRSTAQLAIRAVPGSTIAGLDEPVTVGESGSVTLPVRTPATYNLKATRAGYLPAEKRIYLETDREVELAGRRYARLGLEAGLYGLSFPFIDASVFAIPGWLYIKAGLMTYLGGLALNDAEIFWGEPLSTLSAEVGTYAFLPPESPLRFYLAAGAFLRLAHPPGSVPPVWIDPIAPWGLQLTLGLEASPWPRSRFFLEVSPTEYVTAYPDLLRPEFSDRNPSSIGFLPFGVVDFAVVRLGWRWLW